MLQINQFSGEIADIVKKEAALDAAFAALVPRGEERFWKNCRFDR